MKVKNSLGETIYSENFLYKKVIDIVEIPLIIFITMFINSYSYAAQNPQEQILFRYASYILPAIWFAFVIWGFSIKVVLYENGIYSNYSLKYHGIWHFRDIEDIYIKPYPYGKNMKQIVILLKNGEEKTVMAYDREGVIERFYEEAKKAFENYKEKVSIT